MQAISEHEKKVDYDIASQDNIHPKLLKFYGLYDGVQVKDSMGREWIYTKERNPVSKSVDETGVFIPLKNILNDNDRAILLYQGIRMSNALNVLKNTKSANKDLINNALRSYIGGKAIVCGINRLYHDFITIPGFIFYNGTYEYVKA